MATPRPIYDNYKKLRDKNYMSDYYVEQKTGVSRAIMCFWRTRGTKVQRKTIEKLADFFNVPVSYFYEVQENEKTEDSSCAG